MNKVFIIALPEETDCISKINGIDILYSGVGKINAATAAGYAHKLGYDEIINIGSCGSLKHSPGTIINVGKVYEDIDIRPLCEYGYTSREGSNNYIVSDTNYTCFTTDYFVDLTHKNKYSEEYIKMIHSCDIFDMECFAIASVCNKFNIKFSSYKWVSDNGNGSDWKENCKLGLNSVINLL
jgi:adenosylhomocysteine nucleosidase